MPRRYEVDPQGPFIWADADFANITPWRQTDAEIAAGVTPTNYAYAPGIFERYGAVGDGATNDNTALANALLQSSQTGGSPAKAGGRRTYLIGANTLTIPNNGVLDISSASIVSTNAAAITFGTNSTLFAYDKATITSSGAAGAALKMTSTASPAAWYIYGWPALAPTSLGTASGIGLDFTGAYKGIFEIQVSGFETNITGGTASVTPQTYYNELRSPRIVGTSGLTGIQLLNGCNATTIVNPQINGASTLTKGIYINQGGAATVIGGYVEGFLANANTRGLLLTDATNITVTGTVFDQGTDATASFAIGSTGASTQCNFHGLGFGGAWGSSDRIMTWTASGVFNFVGGNPTNQLCIIGKSTFATLELNGTTRIGKLFSSQITSTVAAAADNGYTFDNTADGIGVSLSNNSATKTAARAALVVNRAGGTGYILAAQNAGAASAGSIVQCTGTPESQITAVVGTIALRTDGGAATTLYVKESGSGNTGWVAK